MILQNFVDTSWKNIPRLTKHEINFLISVMNFSIFIKKILYSDAERAKVRKKY